MNLYNDDLIKSIPIDNDHFKNLINDDLKEEFNNSINKNITNTLCDNKTFNENNILQSELISYSIEYKNELYQPDILVILQLKDKIVINNCNCYYLAIRFFSFNQIEISFYEEYYEIDDINDKGRFQISITDNPEWSDCFNINDNLSYPDSEYIIKDINFICTVINNITQYIVQAINLYKSFLQNKSKNFIEKS